MLKKPNKILFRAQSEHVWKVRNKPLPSSNFLPKWWKDMSVFFTKEKKITLNPAPNVTVKRCAPTLDGLLAGYIVTLWADLLVEQENGLPMISWNTNEPVVSAWPDVQVAGFEIPKNYSKTVFKYHHGWTIKTPKNYSSLILHPIGYQNLPFKIITGLVDTDILETDINTPFVVESGFTGIIEKGTPMFQVIPIKRDSWKSDFIKEEKNEFYLNSEILRTKIISGYGKMRQKKQYK